MKKGFLQLKLEVRNSTHGFTLVELLVVIGILGVLAAAVLTAVNPAAQLAKTRNSNRKTSLKQIADALERYHTVNGKYPVTATWCGAPSSSYTSCGADWIPGLVASGELKILPQDPRVGESFAPCNNPLQATFLYYSTGIEYKVLAFCGLEGPPPTSDPFLDPRRPTNSWSVYSPGGANF